MVYIIILIFIKATFKFIGIITTVLIEGSLGILGPFYSNNKSAKKKRKVSSLLNYNALLN